MALNAWQLITRVLPGKPFGDAKDGNYNSATVPTMVYRSMSGTVGSTTLTLGSSGFADGDILVLWQTRGTGAGQWELNRIVSGGGTTTLTLQKALQYTYTDSGNSQAQAIKLFRFANVTIPSGTWSPSAWDGDIGGVLTFACAGRFTPTGLVDVSARGFVGKGIVNNDYFGRGRVGENSTTAGGDQQNAAIADGGGGGGGGSRETPGGGGGGGHATAGANGAGNGPGIGGGVVGVDDLSLLFFGGAAGSGGGGFNVNTGQGGKSSGIFLFFAKFLAAPVAGILSNGGDGDPGNIGAFTAGDGGGGPGGSILGQVQKAILGTDKFSLIGGTSPAGNGFDGGPGGKGRLAIHYGQSVSGSVSSSLYGSFTQTLNTKLVDHGNAALFAMI